MNLAPQIQSALENIYISPLELCNLNCRLCYTNKTKHLLSNRTILSFLKRYNSHLRSINYNLRSILFCGGEVFTLKNFPRLINNLDKKGVFVSIITNGTIDRLPKINNPQNCQLLVSFDGPEDIHDQNRGAGNFQKSAAFVRHALNLGFPVSIMFLITPASYPYRSTFPSILVKAINLPNPDLTFTYITQKTIFYTEGHPLSNQENTKKALSAEEILDIKKNFPSVPDRRFGCFQLSLQSNGLLYGCCESPKSLGSLHDPIQKTLSKFLKSLDPCQACTLSQKGSCFGCTNPDFLCGYKKELSLLSCQDVVKSFNS